jgi:hypothetical protein
VPVLFDWRLRECDYGSLNGAAASDVHEERLRFAAPRIPMARAASRRQSASGAF